MRCRSREVATTSSRSARTTSRCRRSAPRLKRIERRADRRARLRADPRPAARALHQRRHVPRLLGHRRAPRPAVAAEPPRPRAGRRHRPGQDARRSHRARQRARRHRPRLPLRRLRPRRPPLPADRAARAGSRRSRTRSRSTTSWCAERPDLAAELYEPQPYDFRGEQRRAPRGWYPMPVFTELGRPALRAASSAPYILASQRHADAPRLTARAREATASGCTRRPRAAATA